MMNPARVRTRGYHCNSIQRLGVGLVSRITLFGGASNSKSLTQLSNGLLSKKGDQSHLRLLYPLGAKSMTHNCLQWRAMTGGISSWNPSNVSLLNCASTQQQTLMGPLKPCRPLPLMRSQQNLPKPPLDPPLAPFLILLPKPSSLQFTKNPYVGPLQQCFSAQSLSRLVTPSRPP